MTKIVRKQPSAEDRQVSGYVSVNPSGLVVSTGSGTEEDRTGDGQGTISLFDRKSGLAVQLDHDAALKLAASLLRAGSFLREAKTGAQQPQGNAMGAIVHPDERHVSLVPLTVRRPKRSKLN